MQPPSFAVVFVLSGLFPAIMAAALTPVPLLGFPASARVQARLDRTMQLLTDLAVGVGNPGLFNLHLIL
jgi:hypothetical protein